MTYSLEPQGETVKLTVLHEIDKPDSRLIQAVSNSWPHNLASLKSLLETDVPLEATSKRPKSKRRGEVTEMGVSRKARAGGILVPSCFWFARLRKWAAASACLGHRQQGVRGRQEGGERARPRRIARLQPQRRSKGWGGLGKLLGG